MTTLLAMFAKFWAPGEVKTRLAASIGAQRATAIHRLFVETLCARFKQTADTRVIVFTPVESAAGFHDLAADGWQLTPQTEGDLGQRMATFFEDSLAEFDRVVLIGSDSPDLPAEYVSQAFAALDSHDVVLGPAHDGGYYFVGAARRMPPIFEVVDWGTHRVWPQTIDHLRAAACDWHELPRWFDVDDEAGLRALLARLEVVRQRDDHLAQLANSLAALLSDRAAV